MDSEKKGFTLVELLVVISIIALLVSILMPSLNKAREQAKRVLCSSSMRQIDLSLVQYAMGNNDWFAGIGDGGSDKILLDTNVLQSDEVFACPNDRSQDGFIDNPSTPIADESRTRSYTFNLYQGAKSFLYGPRTYGLWRYTSVNSPSERIIMSEAHVQYNFLYSTPYGGFDGPIFSGPLASPSVYWQVKLYHSYSSKVGNSNTNPFATASGG